ncbi:MAG: hypothetical protein ACTS7D_01795 [Candidatus Hodgkinia cicadicola]
METFTVGRLIDLVWTEINFNRRVSEIDTGFGGKPHLANLVCEGFRTLPDMRNLITQNPLVIVQTELAHIMAQTCLKSVICAILTPFNEQSQPISHAIKLSRRQFGFQKPTDDRLVLQKVSTNVGR